VVTGGGHDRAARYITPTVLADVAPDAPVMAEEIFGPLLPILRMPDLDAALTFINAHGKPLALYAFTTDRRTRRRLLTETSSGAVGFGGCRTPISPFPGCPSAASAGAVSAATTEGTRSRRSATSRPFSTSRSSPTPCGPSTRPSPRPRSGCCAGSCEAR
jgi:acyl-CoA reductase-like NAD-dependent aldehyde dehydrogenase